MNRRRTTSLVGTVLFLAGLGAAVGIGAWHAKSTVHASGASQRSTTAKTTSSPNLAAALYQNSHLMTARSDYARSGAGEPGVRIVIPAIGLDAPVVPTGIVSGVWQVADWAVGYLQGSALPGQCTEFQAQHTCATDLAGHDDIKGELFKNLGALKKGQKIYLYTRHHLFTYAVSGRQTVDPSDGSVLNSPTKQLTMVTCEPYWIDTSRLILSARLVGEQPRSHSTP